MMGLRSRLLRWVSVQLEVEHPGHPEHLATFCRDIVDGCLAHQRPDGLFHDVVDQPATFVETNLAQMLDYAERATGGPDGR